MKGRRGISWRDQTLASSSPPPFPLMVFFGLVILLMYFATYSHYRAQAERSMLGFKLLLFLLPLLLILFVHLVMLNRWIYIGSTRINYDSSSSQDDGGSSSPWGLALFVMVVLVLVYYHSSAQHTWFRPPYYWQFAVKFRIVFIINKVKLILKIQRVRHKMI